MQIMYMQVYVLFFLIYLWPIGLLALLNNSKNIKLQKVDLKVVIMSPVGCITTVFDNSLFIHNYPLNNLHD